MTSTNEIKSNTKFDDQFLTFSQTAERYAAFSEGSLRWARFNNTRDFNKCVRKLGKKCVISIPDFHEWIEAGAGIDN